MYDIEDDKMQTHYNDGMIQRGKMCVHEMTRDKICVYDIMGGEIQTYHNVHMT